MGVFDFAFSTTKSTFKLREGVPLTLFITNTGPDIIATGGGLGIMKGNRMNLLVEKGGSRVWRKIGTGFGDYRESGWLAGEKRGYSFTWIQLDENRERVTSGTYRITPFVPSGVNVGVTDSQSQVVAPSLEITIE